MTEHALDGNKYIVRNVQRNVWQLISHDQAGNRIVLYQQRNERDTLTAFLTEFAEYSEGDYNPFSPCSLSRLHLNHLPPIVTATDGVTNQDEIRYCSLFNVNFKHSVFNGVTFIDVNFVNCDLSHTWFMDCYFDSCRFTDCTLAGAHIEDTENETYNEHFEDCTFISCNLENATFNNIHFSPTTQFINSNLYLNVLNTRVYFYLHADEVWVKDDEWDINCSIHDYSEQAQAFLNRWKQAGQPETFLESESLQIHSRYVHAMIDIYEHMDRDVFKNV